MESLVGLGKCSINADDLFQITSSRTREVLQGTISKLESIQQNASLAPGFLNLVRVVRGISEVVSVSFSATYIWPIQY